MPLTLIVNGVSSTEDTADLKKPALVSIRSLGDNVRFEIPVYQRGFRWTRQQIKELIDDLYEFSKDKDENRVTYCLQNITLRKKESEDGTYVYEVVDGQQRLTAIWILIMAYMDSRKYDESEEMPGYSLFYEEKKGLTNYVSELASHVREKPSSMDILDFSHPNDIDSSFIYDAFCYVINDYKNENNKYMSVLNAIFNDDFYNNKKEISVIWNEIKSAGSNEEEKNNYTITRFSNINANKIPLTESELIKAYFIDKLKEERVQEFSLQWEEMERGLNNDEFWWFITSGKEFETRMDLLFQVYLCAADTVDKNGQHILSRSMSDLFNEKDAYETWSKIVQIYNTLNDWFNDYFYYHVIGLIIAVENGECSEIINDLYESYRNSNKEEFRKSLKKRIRNEECYMIPFLSGGSKDWNINNSNEILLEGRDSYEISYSRNKWLVKPILLLFNITLLLNAYSINPENAAERFSFKIYKNKENPIEIEHINPQHLEGKNADGQEYSASEKKDWALKTIEIIEDSSVKRELEEEIKSADWKKANSSLIEKIEVSAQLNTLSNLTLIDKSLNCSYGDKFFNDKRNHVLAARFGNSVIGNENKRYTQSVIFPGTMWIFMRQYNNISYDVNENCEKGENDGDRWEARARREYIKCMQDSFFRFLSLPEDVRNEKQEEVAE